VQVTQVILLRAGTFPASQNLQSSFPVEYFPPVQSEQPELPAVLPFPATQGAHIGCPAELAYFPGVHDTHSLVPAFPMSQASQTLESHPSVSLQALAAESSVPLLAAVLPGAQMEQYEAPSPAYIFPGQVKQAFEPNVF
jgi:hypothetical protein